MNRIYLASQSPRRRELLKQIGVRFDLLLLRNDPRRQIDVDELPLAQESPAAYVERVCREKVQAAQEALRLRALRAAPILTADTVVTINGEIIGKPDSDAHAAEILRKLSGGTHEVITAVAVVLGERTECRVEAHDKAGAYGIQGQAAAFVAQLEGSYSGVVGLPLYETAELLKSFGVVTP